MLQLIAIVILFLATTLLYCSNRHQRLFNKPIAKGWRQLAFILCIIAIGLACYAFSHAAAVFFIILILMLALMIMPFISLLKRKGAK
ncbi:hypothetical protein [Pseudoalteromonas arctica]|uniref:Uncharacterized protein n=1 Tax=Pseudoalteromonas arctica TaxID=394751 RepID=A0A7Y0DQV0_9GAMM|nr:hypothetical protein [Pseudoalteromonas arctica]NMM39866.1 hypothetical protein [Pseudoalteromonas arctica]